MKHRIAPLAIGMIVVYAALAIGAANCFVLHAEQSSGHHHGHSHVAHSALCAWACQINPTVTVPAAVSLVAGATVIARLRQTDSTVRIFSPISESPSRAPPR
jgi:hypothetical protein